jgi:hypothetical protein
MSLQEIPRKDWKPFFDNFSRQHVNDCVAAEVRSETERGRIADHLALQGITADPEDQDKIQIVMGDASFDDLLITHVVESPKRVLLREDNGHEAIEIEATDGTCTTVEI